MATTQQILTDLAQFQKDLVAAVSNIDTQFNALKAEIVVLQGQNAPSPALQTNMDNTDKAIQAMDAAVKSWTPGTDIAPPDVPAPAVEPPPPTTGTTSEPSTPSA